MTHASSERFDLIKGISIVERDRDRERERFTETQRERGIDRERLRDRERDGAPLLKSYPMNE